MRSVKNSVLAMDKDEEYRRQAADAQALADKAKNPRDRAAWLRISFAPLGVEPVELGCGCHGLVDARCRA